MRPILLLLLFATACTYYPDDCDRRALNELRTVERLIAETRADLDRGYAYVVEERRIGTGFVVCSGSHNVRLCTGNEPRYRRRAVAIDPEAERRKLDALRQRREELAPRVASCRPV